MRSCIACTVAPDGLQERVVIRPGSQASHNASNGLALATSGRGSRLGVPHDDEFGDAGHAHPLVTRAHRASELTVLTEFSR